MWSRTENASLFIYRFHLHQSRMPPRNEKGYRVYKLNLAICTESYDIIFAECGCPAGKGPSGSCKHIGALCYAFAEFAYWVNFHIF